MRKWSTGAALALIFSLAACGNPGAPAGQAGDNAQASGNQASLDPVDQAAKAAKGNADDAPYYTQLPIKEFMGHVMQYAGEGIWKWQGTKSDATGVHSLFPKTDADWEEAESGARTLAEVTNVLLIPGRRVPDPKWDAAVEEVRGLALKAADAAEKHDQEAFFNIGGQLDEACDTCHKQFDPTFQAQAK